MTELTTVEPVAVHDLQVWAESARAAASIATSLVRTSFVPAQFRGKPEEATAAILSGLELGLSPMAALRSFDIIQGIAAARAITLRAVVQAAGHDIWTEESTPSRAIVCGRRRGSENVERSVWTIARAQQLALTGKDNWKKQPGAMLLARATSECARLVAADAILGIPYSVEELQDNEPTPVVPVTRASSTTRTVKRTAIEPSATPEPPLDDEPPIPAAEPVAEVAMITAPQLKKLHATLNDTGFTDRDLALAFYSETVGRDVDSSKSLTKDEARQVIDRLEALNAPIDEPITSETAPVNDTEPTLDLS